MPDANHIWQGLAMASILAPAFVARWLAARRPEWRPRRILAISALPLPLINLAFVALVSVRERYSPDDCDPASCATLLALVFLPGMVAIGCGLVGLTGALLATHSVYDECEPQ